MYIEHAALHNSCNRILSAPFGVGEMIDKYWGSALWSEDIDQKPTKVKLVITEKSGDIFTFTNASLADKVGMERESILQ